MEKYATALAVSTRANKAAGPHAAHRSHFAWAVAVAAILMSATTVANAYVTPDNLKQGLDGNVQLGALATYGATHSEAVSARSTFTYRAERWEQEFDAKLFRSASEAVVIRRSADGEAILDNEGQEIKDLIKSTTNSRRFVSTQSRLYFTERHYLFGIADYDTNKPANLDRSTRQIIGVGYKLWRTKNDLLGAAVGFGRKQRVEVSGNTENGGIGYLGLRFKRALTEKSALKLDVDSDFGGDNRYTEAEVSLSWKLRDPVSLKIKYEARFNSTVTDPLNQFARGLEAALSINLSLDVF